MGFIQTFEILIWGLFDVELMTQPQMTAWQDWFLPTKIFGMGKLRNLGNVSTLLTMADSSSPGTSSFDSPSSSAPPADVPESVEPLHNSNTSSEAHFRQHQHSRKVLYVLSLGLLTDEDSHPLISIDNEPGPLLNLLLN